MSEFILSWADLFPGLILGFREGLEAFLVIGIMSRFLDKMGRKDLTRSVRTGMVAGLVGSVGIGVALWGISLAVGGGGSTVGKIWESVASLAGLLLLSTFIYWMMKHGKTVVKEVQNQVDSNLNKWGVLGLSAVVVLREGAEIALFAFSSVNQQSYVLGILAGVVVAAVLAYLISKSLLRVNLSVLFSVTLGYLVLQAGYLLGYAVHELLSALNASGAIASDSVVLLKPFNFGNTLLDHKTGGIGIALNVLVGWYSRPEWLPFVLHYGYVALMLGLWRRMLRVVQPAPGVSSSAPVDV
jgi:high-affinity iron transporter